MTISRMQNPQQLQGIGSLRQPYGLGKLVKKAFRGLKKVVKSPIGKAAILGGLGMWGMGAGPFAGKAGAGWLSKIAGKVGASKLGGMLSGGSGGQGFFKSGLGRIFNPWQSGKFSGKHMFGLLGAGAVAAPFVQKALKWGPYAEGEEEEQEDWSLMPSSIGNIVNRAQNYYRQPTNYSDFQFMPEKQFVTPNFYAAAGGRAGLLNGGEAGEAQMEQMLRAEYLKYKNQGGTMPYEQFKILVMQQAQQDQAPNQMMAAGGRTGYLNGEMVEQQTNLIEGPQGGEEFQETVVEGQEQPSREQLEAWAMKIFQLPLDDLDDEQLLVVYQEAMQGQPMEEAVQEEDVQFAANGGRIGYNIGQLVKPAAGRPGYKGTTWDEFKRDTSRDAMVRPGDDSWRDVYYRWLDINTFGDDLDLAQGGRVGAQEGGLIDLGGMEKDYRENGGFVPLGGEERADDVPARLSKNEFVFTADAVRAAGGGDIDAGSEVMQNVMDNLEQGGEVSEESQGQNPAQGMYNNYEQLQSRVA